MSPELENELLNAGVLAIEKIVMAIADARSGKVDGAKVLAHLSSVHDSLQANNVAIDAEIAAKYPEAQPK